MIQNAVYNEYDLEAAKKLDFLQAAQYRDEIIRLQKEIEL